MIRKFLPIAIASPTDFIDVPKTAADDENFFVSKSRNFVTTYSIVFSNDAGVTFVISFFNSSKV